MNSDILGFFNMQQQIFGVCPNSGKLFRLSECRIFAKTPPEKDWMTKLQAREASLDQRELDYEEKLESVKEKARVRGRRLAMRAVRRIDPVFTPRNLNPDDAKVIFHPVDYVVFKGMKEKNDIREIVILDRKDPGRDILPLQKSIEKAVEKGRYEWQTLRVKEDGGIERE